VATGKKERNSVSQSVSQSVSLSATANIRTWRHKAISASASASVSASAVTQGTVPCTESHIREIEF